MTIRAHPLTWPEGWPRTAGVDRTYGRFVKNERQHTRYPDGSSRTWDRKRDLTIAEGVARVLITRMDTSDEVLLILGNEE